jgi:hypothetical protein
MSGCGVCSAPMGQPNRGRRRVYCSNACRQRAYRAAVALRNAPSVHFLTNGGIGEGAGHAASLQRFAAPPAAHRTTKLDAELRPLVKRAIDLRLREIMAAQRARDRALFREVAA